MNADAREGQILIEQHLAEAKVLSEATRANPHEPIAAFLERYRTAAICPTCGKTTAVINVARRGFRAERVSAETHCVCRGGPVDLYAKGALNTLEVAK